MTAGNDHAREIAAGSRFEFGANWTRFLEHLNDSRIAEAERSMQAALGRDSLAGTSFLDIGSGSGLFSLAARRLGARVHSFDYDPASVACTAELRRRYFPDDSDWVVEQGSVLDLAYLESLGSFDIVYSWGVLHHSGDMWKALANVDRVVAGGGLLLIAIYNEQPYWTRLSTAMKKAYVRAPRPGKWSIAGSFMAFQAAKGAVKDIALLRNPAARYRNYSSNRGMSMLHDWIDWVGGYPFEAAKPEAIFDFFRARGYVLERLFTCGGGHGCNEFLFRKTPAR
jgi:2-polyprenyl-6-hydroxyphenyl methylase/3-demethylubiquinone-9 3-methyltransferase